MVATHDDGVDVYGFQWSACWHGEIEVFKKSWFSACLRLNQNKQPWDKPGPTL